MRNFLLLPGMAEVFATKAMCEYKSNECITRWEQSKNLPRKSKKLARKEILLDYSIYIHAENIFNFC